MRPVETGLTNIRYGAPTGDPDVLPLPAHINDLGMICLAVPMNPPPPTSLRVVLPQGDGLAEWSEPLQMWVTPEVESE